MEGATDVAGVGLAVPVPVPVPDDWPSCGQRKFTVRPLADPLLVRYPLLRFGATKPSSASLSTGMSWPLTLTRRVAESTLKARVAPVPIVSPVSVGSRT